MRKSQCVLNPQRAEVTARAEGPARAETRCTVKNRMRDWVGAETCLHADRDQSLLFSPFCALVKNWPHVGKNVQTRTKSGDSRPPKKETDKIKKPSQEFAQG